MSFVNSIKKLKKNLDLNEKNKYDQMEHHFRSSQAGILASSLKENEPCVLLWFFKPSTIGRF